MWCASHSELFCSSLLPLVAIKNSPKFLVFTFEHFLPHCVAWRNRRGLRLRGGELESVPVEVEHEEPLQEIVHDALNEGDFDLTTVASGREAIAMIESGVVKYSALVADVNLKGPMKGWEIARLVRQIDPHFPSST